MTWDVTKPALTTKIKDGPEVIQANWDAIEAWTNSQHLGITCASSGCHIPGECGLIMIHDSDTIEALSDVACALAYETTSGDFVYNNGTAWVNMGGPIEQGTIMLFYQDTAPTGWTINDSVNDKLAFITKGSAAGGQTGGGVHSTGTWTQETHTHTTAAHDHGGVVSTVAWAYDHLFYEWDNLRQVTTTHNHSISEQAAMTTNTNAAVTTWRPSAYNVIQCKKD